MWRWRLWSPVGFNHENLFRFNRIVGAQPDVKFMGTAHPLVHRVNQAHLSVLAGLNCRRTDDRAGRSAALNQLNLRLAQNLQRLLAGVAQLEGRLDGRFKFNVAVVNRGPVHCQPR